MDDKKLTSMMGGTLLRSVRTSRGKAMSNLSERASALNDEE